MQLWIQRDGVRTERATRNMASQSKTSASLWHDADQSSAFPHAEASDGTSAGAGDTDDCRAGEERLLERFVVPNAP